MDVQISFGPYTPARAADGFSRTTFQVPRPYVENYDIGLTILRGGLQIGGPATIPTEYVICNDATLIIGPRPRYSFFHGDVLHEPQPDEGGEQPADSADADTAVSK
jgi:hypothetical protein